MLSRIWDKIARVLATILVTLLMPFIWVVIRERIEHSSDATFRAYYGIGIKGRRKKT